MEKRPELSKRNIVQEIADEVRTSDSNIKQSQDVPQSRADNAIELFRGIQFRGGIKDRAILHSRLNELLERHAKGVAEGVQRTLKASESARERETGELKSRIHRYRQAILTLNQQHAMAMNEAIGGALNEAIGGALHAGVHDGCGHSRSEGKERSDE